MSQPSFARSQINYWIGLVLILLVLVVIAWNTVSSFHNSQITEIESESEQHIQFLRDIIQEKLQDKNYTSVETLLYQWGEQHSRRIAEVTLVMANGFVLGAYQSETISAHHRSFSIIIPFSYQDSATLNLLVNLESAYTRTRELINILGLLIVAFTLFLTIMMWLFLRKQSLTIELKRHSEFLSNTVANLKNEIMAREEAENAVIKSERKFRLLADHTQDWEYWVEPDGKYLYLSPACEKITGYSSAEFLSNPQLLFDIVKSGYSHKVHQHYHDENNEKAAVFSLEFPIVTKNGEERWLEHNCSPIFDEQGQYMGRRGNNRDITARKHFEKQRLDLETQLRQKYKMEAVGVMAGGIAHDFNNNLAIILGNIELTQLSSSADSKAMSRLEDAKIAALRARDLVQQILTYSRHGDQDLKPVQINSVIDETLRLLRSTIPTSVKIKKKITDHSQDIIILADSTQLQEILINFCNNAVHAMNDIGEIEISLEAVDVLLSDIPAHYNCSPGQYAKLSVQDTGSGMSSETLKKVFDPFYTTKEVGQGTGMGLAVVHGIIETHGGFVVVKSILGEGSTFDVYFPMPEAIQVETKIENTDLPRGTERILFLDDDEMLAQLGGALLSEHGYHVTVATNSTHALELFKENPEQFDLVITDQTMPELSGKDFIKELLYIRPDLPTILCTGYSNKINEAEAKQLGIRAFCLKPLDLPVFLQIIRQILDDASNYLLYSKAE